MTDGQRDTSERSAAWYPDPLGRADVRWFNGTAWTADVAVDGRQFVDPLGVSHSPVGAGAPRGRAVAALVVGCSAVAVAWMPVVFAIGAVAGIVAIVLAISALRSARRGTGGGRSFAAWGLAAGVTALPVAVLGAFLTVRLVDEIDRLLDVGPVEHEVACVVDGRVVSIDGSVTNLSEQTRDYVVEVEVADGTLVVAVETTIEDDVGPGERRTFDMVAFLDAPPRALGCTVSDVRAPSPLG